MPADAEDHRTWFDKFATHTENVVSKAPFFFGCVLLVLIWGPSLPLWPTLDTWQLIINTVTTIVTFLLVALLQNTQKRGSAAIHKKLNAIAEALAITMDDMDNEYEADQLRRAVGIEEREGT
jgi:low affinity Fe/Cu permease